MLIYNHKKEFWGIDEDDLKALGLSSIEELQDQAADFADLFVKKPGFIHNFKHMHWIDYITCNNIDSKVILRIKDKNYAAHIKIKTIYLINNPSKKAYGVNLRKIKLLSDAQDEKISTPMMQKPARREKFQSSELYDRAIIPKDAPPKNDENSSEKTIMAKQDLHKDSPNKIKEEDSESIHKQLVNVEQKEEKSSFAEYVYNPEVASEKLGLPVDLIEEFIQDFIAQAESFKNDLYEAANTQDLNQLRVLSHKLKGVAANLRIENALNTLITINTSNDDNEIKTNLEKFYKIIDKLSHKEEPAEEKPVKKAKLDNDDTIILSFKEDVKNKDLSNLQINDSQVPDFIEITELADDEFLKPKITINQDKIADEDLSIFDDYDYIFQEKLPKKSSDTVFNYDKKQIADDIGLDIKSFNELFKDYLNEMKKLSNNMLESIQKSDINGCKSAALKIKGMSQNMRVPNFDQDLNVIMNADNIYTIDKAGKNIIATLNKILDIENR
jgi:HPt (histidine-containing phosphotransfer) domain-containing protein